MPKKTARAIVGAWKKGPENIKRTWGAAKAIARTPGMKRDSAFFQHSKRLGKEMLKGGVYTTADANKVLYRGKSHRRARGK